MNKPDETVGQVLSELRRHCGDSEFGYRMQALFAHLMIRQGARVLEINAQGHPDIRARFGDLEMLVQVKTVAHRSSTSLLQLLKSDLSGTTALGRRTGFFAILDCAEPAQWLVIPNEYAKAFAGRAAHIATLRALRDVARSEDYNADFDQIIIANRRRLQYLSYRLLCTRALSNHPI